MNTIITHQPWCNREAHGQDDDGLCVTRPLPAVGADLSLWLERQSDGGIKVILDTNPRSGAGVPQGAQITPAQAEAMAADLVELVSIANKADLAAAKERQRDHGGTAPGKPADTGSNLEQVKAKTRHRTAKATGFSATTLDKAAEIRQHIALAWQLFIQLPDDERVRVSEYLAASYAWHDVERVAATADRVAAFAGAVRVVYRGGPA